MKLLLLFCLSLTLNVLANDIHYELPGVHIRDYALSTDGSELYLTIESIAKDASQIIRLTAEGDAWSKPAIATFSGRFKDLEPFLHPNGLQLFFASNRNAEQDAVGAHFNIWVVNRSTKSAAWEKPHKLGPQINGAESDEFYPSVANNGNLYFTATKPTGTGKEDIYVSRWLDNVYTEAELLPTTINSDTYEFNAYISPNEDILLFSSYGRKDGLGGGDIYISHKIDGQWQIATNLGTEINSQQLDYCPYYDSKSMTLYWTSNQSTLKNAATEKQDFDGWYNSFTQGTNGMSKIYKIEKDLSKPVLKLN